MAEEVLFDLTNHLEYPELIKEYKFKPRFAGLTNVVWDIKNGILLKLNTQKEITWALRGFERLRIRAIREIYPKNNPPTYDHIDWPNKPMQLENEENAYWCFMDPFEASVI